jgi:hypothetical protein
MDAHACHADLSRRNPMKTEATCRVEAKREDGSEGGNEHEKFKTPEPA